MTHEVYFPRGIATGNAFCNRTNEKMRLANNLNMHQHTLLISPRRYGKTSLVRTSIDELKLPYGSADLFVAVDAAHIEQSILSGVKNIISKISTPLDQGLDIIRNYFKKINAQWVVGTHGVQIALIPDKKNDPATTILEALQALETLLAKKNQQAILFIDEIQEIGEIAEGKGIEGAIRHVAQESKFLSFIFSGSNRHLLQRMFNDKSRPLYKLCDRITLDRIEAKHYESHINKLAKKHWGNILSSESLQTIFKVTERHPYYVNDLCLRLWSNSKKPPSPEDITACWSGIINEARAETSRELSALSMGQRKILIAIAENETTQYTGKNFLKKVNMTGSSVLEHLKILEEKDYIEKKENNYIIIDPLIKSSLIHYLSEITAP